MAKTAPEQKAVTPVTPATPPAVSPFDFHVYGPRNLSSTTWRDLLRSSWKNANYRRMVIACFIQGVYLLELDRQENRDERNGGALAPQWWRPFKYRLAQLLVDERDGSVYGAVLEWDRQAALSDLIPLRPAGAPAAVVALRGTLLRGATFRRDVTDDLRAAPGSRSRWARRSPRKGCSWNATCSTRRRFRWPRASRDSPSRRASCGESEEAKAAAATLAQAGSTMGRWLPHLYINTTTTRRAGRRPWRREEAGLAGVGRRRCEGAVAWRG